MDACVCLCVGMCSCVFVCEGVFVCTDMHLCTPTFIPHTFEDNDDNMDDPMSTVD